MEFSQAVKEKIGYYVYVLKDPRTNTIFYIGKGCGNRIFHHLACALETPDDSDKLNLIREIYLEGQDVKHYILRHGLTEDQALEIESACIDILGIENLTNKVRGHGVWIRGLRSADEVVQFYDAKLVTVDEPSIIIIINKLYHRFMSDEELFQATSICWKVGPKRHSVKYALATCWGLVREVYEIQNWYKVDDRWAFQGVIAEPAIRNKYINQSVEKYIKKGSRNPIRYTF